MVAGDNHTFADRSMLCQGSLDFAQFDAEAAQLYLLIATAGEFDLARRRDARPVTGAIEALTVALQKFFG